MAERQGVRLDRWAFFWRAAALVFVVRQLLVVAAIARLGVPPRLWVGLFLGHPMATRRSLVYAALIGAAATALADLFVRLVVGPAVRSWHAPRADESNSAGLFRLGASERVVGSSPARLRRGPWPWPWAWRPGTLLLTDRRLWFVPEAWDAEPWECPLVDLRGARLVAAGGAPLGLVVGLPDRLEIARDPGAGADGPEAAVFALPDPAAALGWFAPVPAVSAGAADAHWS